VFVTAVTSRTAFPEEREQGQSGVVQEAGGAALGGGGVDGGMGWAAKGCSGQARRGLARSSVSVSSPHRSQEAHSGERAAPAHEETVALMAVGQPSPSGPASTPK